MALPANPTPTISPAEMQILVSRAGLVLNPGQVADLVLAWRQVAGLIAGLPNDRPMADDMALSFRLPPPASAGARPAAPAPTPKPALPARRPKAAAPKATPQAKAKAKPKAKAKAKATAKPKAKAKANARAKAKAKARAARKPAAPKRAARRR